MDLNGDGHVDMVSGSYGGYPEWTAGSEKGLGVPEFLRDKEGGLLLINKFWNLETEKWDEVDPDNSGHCTSAAVVDWDNDGDFDVILGDYRNGELFLRVNEGTATEPAFATQNQPIMIGKKKAIFDGGVAAPRIADWNGDGQFDVIVGTITGGVYLMQNSGSVDSPKFEEKKTLVVPLPGESHAKMAKRVDATSDWQPVAPGSSFHVEVVDYDRDGDLDLLVGSQCEYQAAPQKVQTPETKQRLAEIEVEIEELTGELDDLSASNRKQEDPDYREKRGDVIDKLNSTRVEQRKLIDDQSEIGDFIWLFRRK